MKEADASFLLDGKNLITIHFAKILYFGTF